MPQRLRQPDVSIVIPARNEAATIERALHSVLAQAWPLERLEVIVVDNGSSDPTATAVQRFARLHPERLIHLVHEPRLGVSRARNRGARSARGRVLLFLDADSRLAPTMVASVLAHIHRGESAVSLRVVADSTDPLDRAFFFAATWLKERVRVPTQLCAVRRDVFWAVGGFNEGLRVAEDYDLLRRIQTAGYPVGFVTESAVWTSTRRLHRWPLRLGLLVTTLHWLLALVGIGRDWPY
ncbi:glycosyltransferase [Thermomicrobium sp. CFH 73360]|uniref:glycosyltransferase n=1 Tax=Thermomicrobium sp. CFH 73360 TaxID=2951987 RepID=UPI0020776CDB|nr:glycosyltransferase [Thermomicrobium sp. CFH 73360]MCM8747001.1 glycosyltransferase [Thermomicrobium sp. CFH 73360]